MSATVSGCEHAWSATGIRWRFGGRMAGTSAQRVEYFEAFLCSRCCERFYVELGDSYSHDSYQKVRFNATPLEPNAMVRR